MKSNNRQLVIYIPELSELEANLKLQQKKELENLQNSSTLYTLLKNTIELSTFLLNTCTCKLEVNQSMLILTIDAAPETSFYTLVDFVQLVEDTLDRANLRTLDKNQYGKLFWKTYRPKMERLLTAGDFSIWIDINLSNAGLAEFTITKQCTDTISVITRYYPTTTNITESIKKHLRNI